MPLLPQQRFGIGQALMQGGQQMPQTGWGALASGLMQGLGGFVQGQGLAQQNAARQQLMQALMGGDQPGASPGATGGNREMLLQTLTQNPDLVPEFAAMKTALAGPKGAEESFDLKTVIDPSSGKPTLVQYGNRGTIRPVSDYGPIPGAGEKDNWKEIEPGHWRNFTTGEETNDPAVFQRSLLRAKSGATNVNTNVSPTAIYNHETGAGMEELYKGIGKQLDQSQSAASAAASTAVNIKRLNSELEGMPTGMGAELRTQALRALKASGLSDAAANAELAKREAAGVITGAAVMEQLNAMKGPATEKERTYLQQITPSIANTPQGRSEIQRVAEHQAARARAIADADAQVMNSLQNKEIQIGDAAKMRRQLQDQVNAEFDKRLGGGGSAPAAAPKKKIKIDANGNIIE